VKLIFSLLLVFFSYQVYAADDGELIDVAKQIVSQSMKDPEAAKFKNMVVMDLGKRRVICGEVNAKNGYGGYVGFKKFYMYEGADKFLIKADDRIMDQLVDLACKPN
jgi:hypothetical protein